jgi:hypothetical protein
MDSVVWVRGSNFLPTATLQTSESWTQTVMELETTALSVASPGPGPPYVHHPYSQPALYFA